MGIPPTGTGIAMGITSQKTQMTLPARPESVALARAAVSELGRELEFDDRRVGDLRVVVTEACMNAAVHAYEGPGGEFHVEAERSDAGIDVTVSDNGTGIRPHPAIGSPSPSARLGLLLMAALSERVEISSPPSGGTRIRVSMSAVRPA